MAIASHCLGKMIVKDIKVTLCLKSTLSTALHESNEGNNKKLLHA